MSYSCSDFTEQVMSALEQAGLVRLDDLPDNDGCLTEQANRALQAIELAGATLNGLVSTINNTGGVLIHPATGELTGCAEDHDWFDLADAYSRACAVLGKPMKTSPDPEGEGEGSTTETANSAPLQTKLILALRSVLQHEHVLSYLPYDPKDPAFLGAMGVLREAERACDHKLMSGDCGCLKCGMSVARLMQVLPFLPAHIVKEPGQDFRAAPVKESACGSCGAVNAWTGNPPEYCQACRAKWSTLPRA